MGRQGTLCPSKATSLETLIWNKAVPSGLVFVESGCLSKSRNSRMGRAQELAVHIRAGTMIKEVGAALALLSLYLLVLFAPLHQAAGLQRSLDALGYAALDSWAVCQPLTVGGSKDQPTVAKCPVAGVGKFELALLTPPALDLAAPNRSTVIRYRDHSSAIVRARPPSIGQARAPPALV